MSKYQVPGPPFVPANAAVSAHAATGNITASEAAKNLTNTGAGAAIVLTLPAASSMAGEAFRVNITAAFQVSLSPAATDAVFLGGNGVDNKNLVIAGVIGNYADIYSDGVNWHCTGHSGVVTKEA